MFKNHSEQRVANVLLLAEILQNLRDQFQVRERRPEVTSTCSRKVNLTEKSFGAG